ncbi:SPFH domain-containing protein [Tengunoibacter tsumagoiensis]|uniref:Band 7 domain-containing protein n=1 Tax=Tengunoibacter tsumagoiensis TaxID=2014871 RepID=A0A401ZTM3_9CHLR|nr:SPFH domain-containing protein [Tengunoibacter tsumagoiensis]GCE10249.1 hypothetical protein KTT_01080 [Tengunoibacter tsumagoiensis]
MSSDNHDPGAVWQGPRPTQGPAQGAFFDAQEPTPVSLRPTGTAQKNSSARFAPANTIVSPVEDDQPVARSAPQGTLQSISQYLFLLIIPFFFCALTCALVLPFIATGHAALPRLGFWPILLGILAITVAQGTAIYYAGNDKGLLALTTLAGLALFLLIATFSLFGTIPGILLLIAVIALGIWLARHCLHPVPEGFVDIIFAQKKYSRTLYAGFNILLPWETIAAQLNVEGTQWICPTQTVQLSREEDVSLRAAISYQVLPEDAYLTMTQVNSWEESLRNLLIIHLQEVALQFQPEDFLTWPQGLQAASKTYRPVQKSADDFIGSAERRQQINDRLLAVLSDKVAPWGVQINWVQMLDVELIPHHVIKPQQIIAQPVEQAQVVEQVAQPENLEVHTTTAAIPVPPAQKPENNVVAPAVIPASAIGTTSTPTKPLREDLLIRAYKEVQDGHVTDPQAIRSIAMKFEEVAKDPVLAQTVSFDPARAALNLYDQARKYEESYLRQQQQNGMNHEAQKGPAGKSSY